MSKLNAFYEKAQQIVNSYTWLKVVLIGDTKCGKTSIIKSYYDVSINNEYNPTIGIDYGFKLYRSNKSDIPDEVRVNIWDFSGDPDFLETRKELYINTDIVIVVYDLSRPITLKNVERWLKEFQKYSNRNLEDIVIGIFANKADLDDQNMSNIETGKKIAQTLNGVHFEMSSKSKSNIQESFEYLIETTISRKFNKCQ